MSGLDEQDRDEEKYIYFGNAHRTTAIAKDWLERILKFMRGERLDIVVIDDMVGLPESGKSVLRVNKNG